MFCWLLIMSQPMSNNNLLTIVKLNSLQVSAKAIEVVSEKRHFLMEKNTQFVLLDNGFVSLIFPRSLPQILWYPCI